MIGGFRYEDGGKRVASLLLGLYDDGGRLDLVGFVSGLPREQKEALVETLAPFVGGAGLHRQGAGRAEPLEQRAGRGLGATRALPRRRGALRSGYRQPLPARRPLPALAARQGPAQLHDGAA